MSKIVRSGGEAHLQNCPLAQGASSNTRFSTSPVDSKCNKRHPPVNVGRGWKFPSLWSDFDRQLPVGVTLCCFGISLGISFLIFPASVLTKLLHPVYSLDPDVSPLGYFVSPFHHSPLLVLGSKREFTCSLGSCEGLGFCEPPNFHLNHPCVQSSSSRKIISPLKHCRFQQFHFCFAAFGSVIPPCFFLRSLLAGLSRGCFFYLVDSLL